MELIELVDGGCCGILVRRDIGIRRRRGGGFGGVCI